TPPAPRARASESPGRTRAARAPARGPGARSAWRRAEGSASPRGSRLPVPRAVGPGRGRARARRLRARLAGERVARERVAPGRDAPEPVPPQRIAPRHGAAGGIALGRGEPRGVRARAVATLAAERVRGGEHPL